MARIRTIKPEFWDDEKLSQVSRDARLLFIGMWNFSDDYGVIKGASIWLKSKVFPYDSIQLKQFDVWLSDLERLGFINPFSANNEKFYYLPTFSRHQVIDRPSKFRNPEYNENLKDSASTRQTLDEYSTQEGKGREGKGGEEEHEIFFPFNSENFLKSWQVWKDYKQKQFRFIFKTKISEQAALKKLNEDSGCDEIIAIKIIENSMANGWQGLFKLKEDGKQQIANDKKSKWANHFAKGTSAGN